jgi:nucleoside-diphosphate-sugar epimerase
MKKILITGGAGFVGYWLSRRLAEDSNNRITIIDNFTRGKLDEDFNSLIANENVEYKSADLTDRHTFAGLDDDYNYVYHLAAVIGVKNVNRIPDQVLYVNAVSTLNIFEFFKRSHDLKRIFFSSTSEVYAGTLKHFGIDIPTDEDVKLALEDITSKRTTYALSKMFGESICFNYSTLFDIPFTIARFHNVYGPRMGFAHVIPETFRKIESNSVVDVPSPNHTRAFCYIDDAIEMIIMGCEGENTNREILNIGNSNEEIRIADLVSRIGAIMGKKITINEQEDTPGSPARRCPDISKVVRLTGYNPSVSLDTGIRKTYDWYKDKLTKP